MKLSVLTCVAALLAPAYPAIAADDLGVRFILPEQGTRWHFK